LIGRGPGVRENIGFHDAVLARDTARCVCNTPGVGVVRGPAAVARGPRGPRLVGREPELAVLEAELRRANGELRCVLILGEPGVGKTRLAHELLAIHRGRGPALTARAYALGETVPFGLWAEALERHLRPLSPEQVVDLCSGFLDDLAGLVRTVAAVRGSAPERDAPRSRMLEGLAVVLGNLAAADRLVVVLDDLHLADASSLEALGYLARDLISAPLLVVATARPEELADHAVATQVLIGLEADGVLQRMTLRPLERDALRALAEATLDQEPPSPLLEWLTQRSQGNPLFALGLLQALVDEGADLSAPRLAALPETLADRVVSRFLSLTGPARKALELLALLGRPVELGDLVRLTAETLETMAVILAGLTRGRMVLEEERGRLLTYEIAHPLVGEVIYEQMGGARRRALHRQVGRTLLEAGRPGEAAPHFARSADVGDTEAIEALGAALTLAEQQEAYREALTILSALVDLLPAEDRRWLEVADAMAGTADWVLEHRADPAALAAEPALRAIDAHLDASSDLARRAAFKLRLAHFLAFGSGDLEAAEGAGGRAVALFEQAADVPRRLVATIELAWVSGLRGDFAAMEEVARAVVEEAEAAGYRIPALRAEGALAMARMSRGAFDDGRHWRRMAALAVEERSAYYRTLALASLATEFGLEGRIDEARVALAEAKATDPAFRSTILLEAETVVCWLAGDFTTALASAGQAEDWNAGALSRRRAMGTIYAALSAVESDQPDEARRLIDKANTVYGGRRWHVFSDGVSWSAGVLDWREGRYPQALAALWQAAHGLVGIGAWPFAAWVLADVAELAAELRDGEAAAEAAAQLGSVADRIASPGYRTLATLSAGWSLLATGTASAAADHAEEAVRFLSGTGWSALHARGLDLLGRALASSDARRSGWAFEAAAAAFLAGGGRWRAERSLAGHSPPGPGGRRAGGPGPGALSRREREVARLAVEGLSAREIGERLFIGERTVESHLTRVYAKLGVGSKLELVRRASELDLG
jgi:DNA-binding CsgD family transcriptional regulator